MHIGVKLEIAGVGGIRGEAITGVLLFSVVGLT